jgi:hypothetical protein
MSITPQYETYRYTSEISRLKAQSVVECRLPGSEIGSILTAQAKVYPTETSCLDGEVKYGGKLLLCIVYEDADGKICRAERGAEFYHKAEENTITPNCFAKTSLTVDKITHKREGSGLYFSIVVGAEIAVYGGKQIEYLTGGENLFCKHKEMEIKKSVCVSGETEGEDEFETDFLGDILTHSEETFVAKVTASYGQLETEGEILLRLCVLKNTGELCSYERIIPFKVTVPCEDAEGEVKAHAKAVVKRAELTQETDGETGGKTLFSYALSVDCFLFTSERITVVDDAFSPVVETHLKKQRDEDRYLASMEKCVERIGGKVSLTPILDGEYTLQCALSPAVEIAVRKADNGWEAEGLITAEVLLKNKDGGYKKSNLSLPFVFPVNSKGDTALAEGIVCGLNIRRKKDGETDAEALVKASVRSYNRSEWESVQELVTGEEYPEESAAFSVYSLRAGEELWDTAKRLRRDPEELKKSNPDLQFPVKDGARIFVYRQIK